MSTPFVIRGVCRCVSVSNAKKFCTFNSTYKWLTVLAAVWSAADVVSAAGVFAAFLVWLVRSVLVHPRLRRLLSRMLRLVVLTLVFLLSTLPQVLRLVN